jgi:cephalosporin hydroxylase
MLWWPLISAPFLALIAVDRISYLYPNKKGYRRMKARWLNRVLRNDFSQTFLVPELRANFGDRCRVDTDISDHLSDLFFEVVNARARLIVELGTRGGESTRALLAAAHVVDAQVLSIDIRECSTIALPPGFAERWTFVESDDVAFANERFVEWCLEKGREPGADIIFVDTSHLYEHTVLELRSWMPHLKVGGLMIFHDTNMRRWMYRRFDNSRGVGGYNNRGVIRAIEEYVGRAYDENSAFCDVTDQFLIKHKPQCNGFTVLKKLR